MDCEHKVSSRVVAAPDATRAPATPTPLFSFYAGRLIHGDEGLECLIGSRDVTLIDGLDPHAHDEPAILWRGCERQQFGIAAATASVVPPPHAVAKRAIAARSATPHRHRARVARAEATATISFRLSNVSRCSGTHRRSDTSIVAYATRGIDRERPCVPDVSCGVRGGRQPENDNCARRSGRSGQRLR